VALPQQLKTARSSNATAVSSIDNVIGEVEQAVADILGVPVNTDITEAVGGGRVKYAQITDSAAIANTVTETAFNKTYTIPANSLAVGNVIKISAFGKYGQISNPNLAFRVRVGGNAISQHPVTVAGVGTDIAWYVEALAIVRAIGVSGQIIAGPHFGMVASVLNGHPAELQDGAYLLTASTFTLDTTASKIADVTAQWGVANASNTVTMRGLTVEIIPASSTS